MYVYLFGANADCCSWFLRAISHLIHFALPNMFFVCRRWDFFKRCFNVLTAKCHNNWIIGSTCKLCILRCAYESMNRSHCRIVWNFVPSLMCCPLWTKKALAQPYHAMCSRHTWRYPQADGGGDAGWSWCSQNQGKISGRTDPGRFAFAWTDQT